MSSKKALLLRAHTKICHIEFNARKYTLRDAVKICKKASLEVIDIISDAKIHLIIVSDCYECVHMHSKIIGMNVYDHVDILYKDKPCGMKIVKLKDIQYFNPEYQQLHNQYKLDKMNHECNLAERVTQIASERSEPRIGGALKSPDSDDDIIFG